MSDINIVRLLTKQDDANFPRLNVKTVAALSEALANILCASSSNNMLQKAGRRDVLMLLQKWCFKDLNIHSNINIDNYDCFLACLNDVKKLETVSNLPTPTILHTAEQHYTQVYELNNRRQQLLDSLRLHDGKKLGNTMFGTTVTKTNPLHFSIIQDLIKEESCTNKMQTEHTQKVLDPNFRMKRIKFLYALLNLNRVNDSNFLNTFEALDCDENLHEYEIEFLEYFWKHSEEYNISDEEILKLLRKYKFIYEKPLIELCTDAILDKMNIHNPNLQKILNFAKKHEEIRLSIISLVYELYACSKYNGKLSEVLELVTK